MFGPYGGDAREKGVVLTIIYQKKMCEVTPVLEDKRTEEEESGKESCILGSQKPQLRNTTDVDKYDREVLATRFD